MWRSPRVHVEYRAGTKAGLRHAGCAQAAHGLNHAPYMHALYKPVARCIGKALFQYRVTPDDRMDHVVRVGFLHRGNPCGPGHPIHLAPCRQDNRQAHSRRPARLDERNTGGQGPDARRIRHGGAQARTLHRRTQAEGRPSPGGNRQARRDHPQPEDRDRQSPPHRGRTDRAHREARRPSCKVGQGDRRPRQDDRGARGHHFRDPDLALRQGGRTGRTGVGIRHPPGRTRSR